MNPAIELNRVLVLLGGQPLDLEHLEMNAMLEKVEQEIKTRNSNREEMKNEP